MRTRALGTETLSIFDEPAGSESAHAAANRLAVAGNSQQERVEAIMGDGNWHTLPELCKEMKRRFGALHGEASISARIRDMRKHGFHVSRERTRPGSNLYQYRVERPSYADLLAAAAKLDDERRRTSAVLSAHRSAGATA